MAFSTGRITSFPIQTCALAALLAATGCASTDARHELDVAAQLSARVTASHDPSEVWSLPVEGESPAWNGTDPLTYDHAVAVALQSNPELRRMLALIRARRADFAQAGLPPNPTVGFGVGIAIDSMSGAPAMVEGMQMLSWLWKNPHRVAAAEAQLRGAIFSAASMCVDIMARTRTQVAEVIGAQQLLAYELEHERIATHNLQLVEAQVEAGELSQLELDRSRVDAQAASAAVVDATHALRESRLALVATMGRPLHALEWTADGPLPPVWNIPDDEVRLLELAAHGRLDVAAAGEQLLQAAAQAELAGTKRVPDVMGMLAWRRNSGDRRSLVPGAQITIPIWDNGDPAVARAHADMEAARLTLLAAQETAQLEVRTSLTRLRNARAQVNSLRNDQLPHAVTAQERSDHAWREGEVSLNTVLDTQRRRIAIEHSLVAQSINVMRAMCALRKAVGGSFDLTLDAIPPIEISKRTPEEAAE